MISRLGATFAFYTAIVTIAISVGGSAFLYRQQTALDETAAHDRGARASEMLARVLTQPVGDYDLMTTEAHVKGSLQDPEVLQLVVNDEKGNKIVSKANSTPTSDDWTFKSPIERDGQKVGEVDLAFSSRRFLAAGIANLQRSAVLTALTVVGLVLLISVLFRLLIGVRLGALVAVCRQAQSGNLTARATLGRRDELGTLAAAFNEMIGEVESSRILLEKKNVELKEINSNLEQIVDERTATIRTILDNVRSGFFLVDKNNVLLDGFTKSCGDLFKTDVKAGASLPTLLGLNPRTRDHFNCCTDMVFEDIFPESASLDQIPQRFDLDGKVLKLEGSVVRGPANEVAAILFTVNDVTDLQRVEQENVTSQAIIKILQQKEAFLAYIMDVRTSLDGLKGAIAGGDQGKIKMILHTLKGNSAAFGLDATCHLLHVMEDQDSWSAGDALRVEESIKAFLGTHHKLLSVAYDVDVKEAEVFSIERRSIDQLRRSMEKSHTRDDLARALKTWIEEVRLKPAADLLGTAAHLVSGLGERLGKEARLVVENGELRIDPEAVLSTMRNLTHLIRNSMDHGIESPAERGGKPRIATINIGFAETITYWQIVVSDDGRGIDLDKVVARAIKSGQVSPERAAKLSPSEQAALILLDGLSTKHEVSNISGRGVGMAAVANAVAEAGGELMISTARGRGTKFEIKIPKASHAVAPQLIRQSA